MTKLAIFLCLLVAVACVPSTQAGLFDSWGEKISQAQEKVTKLVNDAIENFKKQVEAIKQHALDIAADIKKQGMDIMESVNTKISDILKNVSMKPKDVYDTVLNETERRRLSLQDMLQGNLDVDDRIGKITGDAKDVDVTECTDMAKEIKTTALTIMANASYCVVDKIDQASGYIEGINAASQGVLTELIQINEKAAECTANINGIESSMKAFACLGIAMKDATWAVTRKIPEVVINITKMAYLVSTIIPSLSLCSATTSISVLIDQVNAVLSSVEACVNEKMADHFHTTVTTVASSISTTVSTTIENLETTLATTLGTTVDPVEAL